MIIVMIINLYTVRVVLKALGTVDYGINDVIVGLVTMLSSLSSVLSTSIQRFYSSTVGEDKLNRLQNIFSTSLNIYFFLALLVIILGETLGLWFVNTKLVVPENRIYAANWIYQFSIFSFIISFLHVPYSAAIIAHEDMAVFARVSVAESLMKLISVVFIYMISLDGLIIYGASLFLISVIILISYILIARNKYPECRYNKPTEKKLYKELLAFSGWSLFGSVASVGMFQINTILINIYFGPSVNFARAISFQFSAALSSLSGSFLMAIRTPMIKSYVEESYLFLNQIFNLSNKFIFYGLLMVCLPIFFEMSTILSLWLNTSDTQLVLFSRLVLVYALIMSLNNPISFIIHAVGRVKEYHVAVETFTLLVVPVTFVLFNLGLPPYYSYVVMIIAAIISHIVRVICIKKYYKAFNYDEYVYKFLFPAISIMLVCSSLVFLIHMIINDTILRLFLVSFFSVFSIVFFAIVFNMTKTERVALKKLLTYLKRK
jgi:O-antigen/teichoic acid export membrane protein